LGLFVVSVSILKGVIVKSELPDALALVMIKTVLAILGLIIIANLTAKKPHKNHCTWKAILRAQNTDNFAPAVCCFSTHFCGALLQTDTPGTEPRLVQ